MAFNLSRATKLYVSTMGATATSGHNQNNTFEIPILDGYSFSQDTGSDTITLNEAGDAPVRGQKVFNTNLNPAEVSVTTYIRPYYTATTHGAVERILWEALVGAGNVGSLTTNPFKNTVLGSGSGTFFKADFENSDVHELLKLQFFFKLDNTVYHVKDVAINTAEVDFSIDGIAQITWTGQGSAIVEESILTTPVDQWVANTNYLPADTTAEFIKNKLSTMTLVNNAGTTSGWQEAQYSSLKASDAVAYDGVNTYTADITIDGGSVQSISIDSSAAGAPSTIGELITELNNQLEGCNVTLEETGNIRITSISHGTSSTVLIQDNAVTYKVFANAHANFTAIGSATAGTGTGTSYTVPITGGSITIDNGITYLTPEELGVVNVPIGSFTGTRSITGSVTAYLRTGANATGGLLSDLVAATSTVTHDFTIEIAAGGIANNPRAVFKLNHAHLVIPSVNVEDVISTEINFTGLGQSIDLKDELNITYQATE